MLRGTRMRHQGRISSWKDDKGFGFIAPHDGSAPVFIHIKAVGDRGRRPLVGDIVSYEVRADDRGRHQATDVVLADHRSAGPDRRHARRSVFRIVIAICTLALFAAAVGIGLLPFPLAAVYGAASGLAFLAYALDKSAARADRWRISENTLHLFGLAGGWPGALVAQQALRHKSSKASFQLVFWTTVVINCGATAWLLSPSGAVYLRSLDGVVSRVAAKVIPADENWIRRSASRSQQ